VYPADGRRHWLIGFSGDGSIFFGKRLRDWTTVREPRYMVVSPDGKKIASSKRGWSDEPEALVEVVAWDAPGQLRTVLPLKDAGYLQFTSDSKHLFIQTDTWELLLWDVAANKQVRTFGHVGVYGMCLSADGQLLAVLRADSDDLIIGHVEMWEIATGKKIAYPTGHPGAVQGLAWSPDGRRLATISEDVIAIFDPKSGAELRRWVGHAVPQLQTLCSCITGVA
jgi:WD40 repeat protein